jgi:hypothetical protein
MAFGNSCGHGARESSPRLVGALAILAAGSPIFFFSPSFCPRFGYSAATGNVRFSALANPEFRAEFFSPDFYCSVFFVMQCIAASMRCRFFGIFTPFTIPIPMSM